MAVGVPVNLIEIEVFSFSYLPVHIFFHYRERLLASEKIYHKPVKSDPGTKLGKTAVCKYTVHAHQRDLAVVVQRYLHLNEQQKGDQCLSVDISLAGNC